MGQEQSNLPGQRSSPRHPPGMSNRQGEAGQRGRAASFSGNSDPPAGVNPRRERRHSIHMPSEYYEARQRSMVQAATTREQAVCKSPRRLPSHSDLISHPGPETKDYADPTVVSPRRERRRSVHSSYEQREHFEFQDIDLTLPKGINLSPPKRRSTLYPDRDVPFVLPSLDSISLSPNRRSSSEQVELFGGTQQVVYRKSPDRSKLPSKPGSRRKDYADPTSVSPRREWRRSAHSTYEHFELEDIDLPLPKGQNLSPPRRRPPLYSDCDVPFVLPNVESTSRSPNRRSVHSSYEQREHFEFQDIDLSLPKGQNLSPPRRRPPLYSDCDVPFVLPNVESISLSPNRRSTSEKVALFRETLQVMCKSPRRSPSRSKLPSKPGPRSNDYADPTSVSPRREWRRSAHSTYEHFELEDIDLPLPKGQNLSPPRRRPPLYSDCDVPFVLPNVESISLSPNRYSRRSPYHYNEYYSSQDSELSLPYVTSQDFPELRDAVRSSPVSKGSPDSAAVSPKRHGACSTSDALSDLYEEYRSFEQYVDIISQREFIMKDPSGSSSDYPDIPFDNKSDLFEDKDDLIDVLYWNPSFDTKGSKYDDSVTDSSDWKLGQASNYLSRLDSEGEIKGVESKEATMKFSPPSKVSGAKKKAEVRPPLKSSIPPPRMDNPPHFSPRKKDESIQTPKKTLMKTETPRQRLMAQRQAKAQEKPVSPKKFRGKELKSSIPIPRPKDIHREKTFIVRVPKVLTRPKPKIKVDSHFSEWLKNKRQEADSGSIAPLQLPVVNLPETPEPPARKPPKKTIIKQRIEGFDPDIIFMFANYSEPDITPAGENISGEPEEASGSQQQEPTDTKEDNHPPKEKKVTKQARSDTPPEIETDTDETDTDETDTDAVPVPNYGECISLHIGQAGIRMAYPIWELLYTEHGISLDGTASGTNFVSPSFFSEAENATYTPRAVLLDLGPSYIDDNCAAKYQRLFREDQIFSGKEDAAYSYARGYNTIGHQRISSAMDHIRRIIEKCDKLQGFLLYHSMGGGTGAGFTACVLEAINKDYGRKSKIQFALLPSNKKSISFVEPYNAVLATNQMKTLSDCTFIMENQALHTICNKTLGIDSPKYTDLNCVIAQAISSITMTLRFPVAQNANMREISNNLVAFPRLRYLLTSMAPLLPATADLPPIQSLDEIIVSCFDSPNQLVKCNPTKGKFTACQLMFRGETTPIEINASIAALKNRKTISFVSPFPKGFTIGYQYPPPVAVEHGPLAAGVTQAACMIGNNTAIVKAWTRLKNNFMKMYSKKAFVHHFLMDGMLEGEFEQAKKNLEDLENDYYEINSEESDKERKEDEPRQN